MSDHMHEGQRTSAPSHNEPAPALSGPVYSAPTFQLKASNESAIQRNVNPTPVDRKNRDEIFGSAAGPGMTLSQFEAYSRRQADWFTESTLTDPDKIFLWFYLNSIQAQQSYLVGAGDLHLSQIQGLSAADRGHLGTFCRAAGTGTVRVFNASGYTLAQRVQFGSTLTQLESIIPAAVLAVTTSETQVQDFVTTPALIGSLRTYWTTFQPQLQRTISPGAGARGIEFDNLLNFLRSGQYSTLLPLRGKIRNLHRFSLPMLNQAMANWADTSRARPVHLVIHTPHDDSAFQSSAPLFEGLINDGRNLVLFLEGQGSLSAITAQIPTIASTHGQPDGSGGHHIAQALIAGHGQATSVQLAGTGNPSVHNGHVSYPSESMDIVNNRADTQALLDALFQNMDPATAQLVFAGCLVGSNKVPTGTPAANIPGHIAANPSLGQFADQRAQAAGIPAGRVQAARASVGLSAATGLFDPANGELGLQYGFDPNAFGSASTYVATGREPEGVLVSAVELAGTQTPQIAEAQLRARLAAGGTGWWDECTLLFVRIALQGVVPGNGIDIGRVNTLAHMTQIPFLTYWPPNYGITPAHWVGHVNAHPALAAQVYQGISTAPSFNPPNNDLPRQGKLVFEQAWLALGGARVPTLMTFLDNTPQLTADVIQRHLDTGIMTAHAATIFGGGAALTDGRIRLALAWMQKDPSNAHVRAYLDAQVSNGASGPQLSATVQAQLGNISERSILQALGRLTNRTTRPASGGAPPVTLPDANYDTDGDGTNDARVTPNPYAALALNNTTVANHPSFAGRTLGTIPSGNTLQVAGFADATWAVIEYNGGVGYVLRNDITSP